jgi:hypothetical protein
MASTMSEPKDSIGDPFLTHLVTLLSVHELGTNAIVLPYTGPSTYCNKSTNSSRISEFSTFVAHFWSPFMRLPYKSEVRKNRA